MRRVANLHLHDAARIMELKRGGPAISFLILQARHTSRVPAAEKGARLPNTECTNTVFFLRRAEGHGLTSVALV